MKVTLLALAALLSSPFLMQAQNVIPPAITAQHTLNRMSGVNAVGRVEVLTELPVPPPKVVGDTYITEEWQPGSVLMTKSDQIISGVPIRYDLLRKELEVQTANGVKVVPDNRLRSFAWTASDQQTSYFVSGENFTLEGAPLVGCVEVLSDGATMLIKKMDVELKKADYNVAMSVGNQDHEYIKKTRYFYARGKELTPLPRSRKKIEELFAEDEGPLYNKSFSPRNEKELKELFDFYNNQP